MQTRFRVFLIFTLLAPLPLVANAGIDTCGAHTDYGLNVSTTGLVFSSSSVSPHSIELRRGHLLVDGREQTLTSADQERVIKLESGVRQVLLQFKDIALDATDIALDAVESVAVALSSQDAKQQQTLHQRLAYTREELRRGIDSRIQGTGWSDADIDQLVESSVKALMPTIVSQVAADAVRIALSGDEAAAKEFEVRADRLGKDIETRVEARAKVLEQRADALCPQISELGNLAAALDVRVDGLHPLVLFTR